MCSVDVEIKVVIRKAKLQVNLISSKIMDKDPLCRPFYYIIFGVTLQKRKGSFPLGNLKNSAGFVSRIDKSKKIATGF